MRRVARTLLQTLAIPALIISTGVFGPASAWAGESRVQDANVQSDAASLLATVAELRSEVAYLKDRQTIHDVYLRYMRGFDRDDVQLLRTAFWPDAQINYGDQSNTVDEFIVRHLKLHTTIFKSWGHLITNETVDIAGDVAHVEAYVTGLFRPKDDKQFVNGVVVLAGRYVDRLDRRDGEWRIAVREFIPHFWTKDNLAVESYAKEMERRFDCAMGTWDRRDLSYRRPLARRPSKGAGPDCVK